MKVEWATICDGVTVRPGGIDIMGANAAGIVTDELHLPAPIPITLALCVVATQDEAAAGGVLNAYIGVLRPDRTPAGGTNLIWMFERGKRMDFHDYPARQIVPVSFAFEADVKGPYAVGIAMPGEPALWLPYFVGELDDVDA